jgi:SdpC family antimicrobial peptide
MFMTQPFKTAIATALILSVALLGIPKPVLAQKQSVHRQLTGGEIFRGIFFGETPVSQLFPEIWGNNMVTDAFDTKEKVIAWDEFKQRVVAQITEDDAKFMDLFGREMQSGDILRVEGAMGEASKKMAAAMQTLGYLDSEGNPMPDAKIFVFGAVAIVLAVGLAGVGFSLVYYYYYYAVTVYQYRYYKPRPGDGLPQEDARLFEEMLVASITAKLAAQ